MNPTPGQLHALKAIICHLLAHHYRDVIAYGAGWTDQDRQKPIGDTSRHEPRQVDAILDAELQRALEDPDPLRGIAQLTASWAAAFALDPDGITRTKTLGTERMARKVADALPGGRSPLRAAVWDFLRPMLSPRLAALHRHVRVRPATGDDRRARRPPRRVRPRRPRPPRRHRAGSGIVNGASAPSRPASTRDGRHSRHPPFSAPRLSSTFGSIPGASFTRSPAYTSNALWSWPSPTSTRMLENDHQALSRSPTMSRGIPAQSNKRVSVGRRQSC
jgi:hypothetical protein